MRPTLQKSLNTLGLFFLIGMNMLAVLLPLGNKTTGELSDLYPNLFVPAGFTFAIWSVIYILLIIFIAYQWVGSKKDHILQSIGNWFVINALANGLWLVFWHYEYVVICIVIMLVILGSLIMMYRKLNVNYFTNTTLPWQASVPVSVYMGWISVATIANTTVVFVSQGYTELGFGADTWASIVLIVAVAIALRILYVHKDIFFAAVVCWASFGIYSKRAADTILSDPNIEHLSYVSIFVLLIGIVLTAVYTFLKRKKTI
ncbi:MAG: tryptophan-rich sensory protein [Saprospiraceae bacterium]|nr:tryptophan-rich sensory protein [Saprospiraceae bacterium]